MINKIICLFRKHLWEYYKFGAVMGVGGVIERKCNRCGIKQYYYSEGSKWLTRPELEDVS